jgi:murein DD-endopeptidase MepM/ murein hydrolase activator NlpD
MMLRLLATTAIGVLGMAPAALAQSSLCLPPALDRVQTHVAQSGDTVAALAQRYRLTPQTLRNFNPNLTGNAIAPGRTLNIPPVNGTAVRVPAGATWQDLSQRYGIRADVLFELNGCQAPASFAFIPGNAQTDGDTSRRDTYIGLSLYPLPQPATVGLPYGWYDATPNATKQTFHSGMDLLAAPGTTVLAASPGVVVFVGQQNAYGMLVILQHGAERQTRYAHLQDPLVEVGQWVRAGEAIARVGTSGQPDIAQPHLHFEVRQASPIGWVAQDPEIHLQPDAITP